MQGRGFGVAVVVCCLLLLLWRGLAPYRTEAPAGGSVEWGGVCTCTSSSTSSSRREAEQDRPSSRSDRLGLIFFSREAPGTEVRSRHAQAFWYRLRRMEQSRGQLQECLQRSRGSTSGRLLAVSGLALGHRTWIASGSLKALVT